MKNTRGFAKCPTKGCKSRVVLPIQVTGKYRVVGLPHSSGRTVWAEDGLFRSAQQENGAHCEAHDAPMVITPLKGRFAPDVDCNEKCKSATGPNCECACSGRHHGANAEVAIS